MNVVITAAWAAAFTLSALVLAVLDMNNAGPLALVLVQVAGFLLPVAFTVPYTAAVRARAAAGQPAR
ncbi:hypothetical protein OG585_42540 [Streptomyces sp. NBC_01340]|uniref:hypothetical protein n=1 Tax=unclassified Streptomyces TaxID=2593676 RepID=UPI0022501E4B|nr:MULTISPECIES: hypothetical protein [unclassified Streptomyces]MCX4459417.1 hypothetical protein [Streptomyces sp. NBC_01719]MCX4498774.1 hypothetical protein [Streptomyces sp. NBC_01728]MCX4595322.1 hypothetical protein [Streptomyces sp. NBC_01549]WSI43240.1 hypothetical protein OG585_42540 [Streptomyces sp. NBC_01340]